jgi:nitroreductase
LQHSQAKQFINNLLLFVSAVTCQHQQQFFFTIETVQGEIPIMEFKNLVKARRSCRAFDTIAVSEDQIAAIIDAGQWAPSPLNLQPWEFIVITDETFKVVIKNAAGDAKQKVVDNGGPTWAGQYAMTFLDEAPVYIVVTVNPSKGGLGSFFGQSYGAIQAVSACIQNMLLAAADLGLGSLWFTFFDPQKVQSDLNVPDDLEIAGVLLVGKPKKPVKEVPRKEPKIHRQRYSKAH